jgi:hypothetical protein
MKRIISILGKGLLAVLFSIVAQVAMTSTAQAAQIEYVIGQPLPSLSSPVFNTYYNVPNAIGNEADFVRVRPSTGDPTDSGANGARNSLYVNQLTDACAIGSKFDVRTYIHNGADDDLNQNGSGSAVAKNTKLTMSSPLNTNGKKFEFNSTITASNAATVSDKGTLNCANDVRLKLVPQTVKVYSTTLGFTNLPEGAVNGNTTLGNHVLGSGDVWACWNEVMIVVYTVEVIEAEKPPVMTCDSLKVIALNDKKYKFTVEATAQNGATIGNYIFDFGDGKTASSFTNTVEHEYATTGNFKAKASVRFMVNGQSSNVVSSASCEATIKPTEPVYTCDQFTLTLVKDRTYKFDIKATAQNGASIKGYEYNFGDSSEVVKTDKSSVEHTYAKEGNFTATATVVFTVNGEEKRVTNSNCQKAVKIDTKTPMCELPGKGHLPKDSPECKVAGVTTLPKTGAGSIAGLMATVTVAGTALHRRMTLKKNR